MQNLSELERRMLGKLSTHGDDGSWRCFIRGHKHAVCQFFGPQFGRNFILKALRHLQDLGLISKTVSSPLFGGKVIVYRVTPAGEKALGAMIPKTP